MGVGGCPYEELGLRKDAPRDEVKAAFRELAMKYHPDRDGSPAAAERFLRVRTAAEAVLHGKPYASTLKASSPASPMSAWESKMEAVIRRKSFPYKFSAVCLAGGCALFAGVMYQHIYYPMYNARLFVPAQETERKELSDQQRLMNDMLSSRLEELRKDSSK